MFGTETLNVAGLVVGSQLHAQGTGAHEALPGNDAAVVTATTVVQRTQICRQKNRDERVGVGPRQESWELLCLWRFEYHRRK